MKIIFAGILLFFVIPANSKYFQDDLDMKESSLVEVRAVFINCHINENYLPYGSESLRFQREEIFKHNVLRNCKKKLALTVKMTSESGHSSSDEYIPIEHVFDGSNKKRVRLLNPYILRLRREPPFESYKLHYVDTFTVLLTASNKKIYETNGHEAQNRLKRYTQFTDLQDWIAPQNKGEAYKHAHRHREKRFDYDTLSLSISNPFGHDIKKPESSFEGSKRMSVPYIKDHDIKSNYNKNTFHLLTSNKNESTNDLESMVPEYDKDQLDNTEHIFKLYEVEEPDIWFKAQVQLLEKLSTPEGKNVWKDLTKDEPAQISSLCPEWTNEEVNMRYRGAECIPREDFTLPVTGICLLVPSNGKLKDKMQDFIIVPFEGVEVIEENSSFKGSYENSSTNNVPASEKLLLYKRPRRLLVRLTRALFGKDQDNFIIHEGTDKYLRIPYRQPHHAQIELEAKADENQLVYVGASGRLATVVSESTRGARAVVTVQVTNTGLAAARLRPKIRECSPELTKFDEDEIGVAVKPILIPPMHTHKFCLELPLEMTGDFAHCSLVLLNNDDESIAVRDVRIKRGDRCFCVWHCQCVCLNEDPKLLCQEMAEQQQVAAGLAPQDRPRQVRAACYPDVVTTNLLVIIFGVILVLLALGLLKACLGLLFRCVGSWGVDQMLQTPRKLDQYYERSLRDRPVVYDEDGWTVHPDTMKRTVRLISKPMEFMLNVIFFVTMPWLLIWKSLTQIISRCQNREKKNASDYRTNGKKCYSSHDMQGKDMKETRHWRRRRKGLNRWMSPQAEELSTDIWRNGLAPQGHKPPECMRPLLREDQFQGKLCKLHSTVVDSEHEDTEYVLMQMQNSRESLVGQQPIIIDFSLNDIYKVNYKNKKGHINTIKIFQKNLQNFKPTSILD